MVHINVQEAMLRFKDVFNDFLDNQKKLNSYNYSNNRNNYDGYYDDYYNGYYDAYGQYHRYGEKNKNNDEDNFDVDVEIVFYEDITDLSKKEVFNSLLEFSDYCENNGLTIRDDDFYIFMNNYKVYCCIDDIAMAQGNKVILCETSKQALLWTCGIDD